MCWWIDESLPVGPREVLEKSGLLNGISITISPPPMHTFFVRNAQEDYVSVSGNTNSLTNLTKMR
jgi:hypothetical protein